jgi:serine-type D-Ala-D-Ala endopeptidase (penicillin-binding protein 7)
LNRIVHALALSVLALSIAPIAAEAATHHHHHKVAAKATAKREVHSVVRRQRVTRTYTASRHHQVAARAVHSVVRLAPAHPSYGQLAGLHNAPDELDLRSSVALVIDQDTREVLVRKNDSAVLPIASITKLMTGLIISEAKLPMDEPITITDDDIDTEKGTGSRLHVGTTLSRGELLHLALMSSENRAAHALGRTYPGGLSAFVEAMNQRARILGMNDTHYVEPTGLSSRNQSSAQDLARLVGFASSNATLRELTTSPEHDVEIGNRTLQFHTTNRLVKNPAWNIGLQKTGFINEAGQCMVMQAKIAGRKLIMVLLDSSGRLGRIYDAERVRKWVETHAPAALPSGNTIIRQVNG